MSLHHSAILNSDPEQAISFGVGLVIDVAEQIMSPERAAAERAALAKEALELEAENEARRQDVLDAQRFWSAMHGVEPVRNGPAEVLKAHAEATERADRAERARQAREHTAECGCETCNATRLGTADLGPMPKTSAAMLRESQANIAALDAKPVTMGDLRPAVAEARVAALKTDRKLGALARFLKGEPV